MKFEWSFKLTYPLLPLSIGTSLLIRSPLATQTLLLSWEFSCKLKYEVFCSVWYSFSIWTFITWHFKNDCADFVLSDYISRSKSRYVKDLQLLSNAVIVDHYHYIYHHHDHLCHQHHHRYRYRYNDYCSYRYHVITIIIIMIVLLRSVIIIVIITAVIDTINYFLLVVLYCF